MRQCPVMMPPRLTTGARPLRSPTGSPPEPAPSHSRKLTDGAGAPDTSPAPSVGGTTPHAPAGARGVMDTRGEVAGASGAQPAGAPPPLRTRATGPIPEAGGAPPPPPARPRGAIPPGRVGGGPP